jgi:hypothetical protein
MALKAERCELPLFDGPQPGLPPCLSLSGTCTTEVPVLFIILHRDLVHTMTLPCYVVILGRDLVHTMALPCSVVILGRELVQTVTHPCYQD